MISAGYRLSPSACRPDQLVDAKRVLAWVRSHAGGLGADGSTVVLAGGSAGAVISGVDTFLTQTLGRSG